MADVKPMSEERWKFLETGLYVSDDFVVNELRREVRRLKKRERVLLGLLRHLVNGCAPWNSRGRCAYCAEPQHYESSLIKHAQHCSYRQARAALEAKE
jgi:hypothetical protein